MTQTEIILKMVFDRWEASLKNCNGLLDTLSDESLLKQIAPNKNRGVYLLGHLIAVHDDLIRLLDIGEKQFPELRGPFLESPDNVTNNTPTVAELRNYWNSQCVYLKQKMDALMPEQWFEKHTAVSEEDFLKEPHRNKLNIIITRTTHLQYHLGQMVLLK